MKRMTLGVRDDRGQIHVTRLPAGAEAGEAAAEFINRVITARGLRVRASLICIPGGKP